MRNLNGVTWAATVIDDVNQHPSQDARPRPATPPPMIALLHNDQIGKSSDLDPVMGVAASVLVSASLYGAIGAVIAYFFMG